MREIKFRAWSGGKIWRPFTLIEELNKQDEGLYPKDTVFLQYTGLKDKNGKEIYEGDIVRILYTDWCSKSADDKRTLEQYKIDIALIGVVVYEHDRFYIKRKDKYFMPMDEGTHGYKEIIGNIYENPELLTPTDKEKL